MHSYSRSDFVVEVEKEAQLQIHRKIQVLLLFYSDFLSSYMDIHHALEEETRLATMTLANVTFANKVSQFRIIGNLPNKIFSCFAWHQQITLASN